VPGDDLIRVLVQLDASASARVDDGTLREVASDATDSLHGSGIPLTAARVRRMRPPEETGRRTSRESTGNVMGITVAEMGIYDRQCSVSKL
jgi:hypothetical protein